MVATEEAQVSNKELNFPATRRLLDLEIPFISQSTHLSLLIINNKMNSQQIHSFKRSKTSKRCSQEEKEAKTSQKNFDLSQRLSIRFSAYSSLEDNHSSSYFMKDSVQKHLRGMIQVHLHLKSDQAIDTLPKNDENRRTIRGMNILAGIQTKTDKRAQKECFHSRERVNREESQDDRNSILPIRIKKSPYRLSLRHMSESRIEDSFSFRNQLKKYSELSLPPLNVPVPTQQKVKADHRTVKGHWGARKQSKGVQRLHRLRHNVFLSFIDKKKREVTEGNEKLKNKLQRDKVFR